MSNEKFKKLNKLLIDAIHNKDDIKTKKYCDGILKIKPDYIPALGIKGAILALDEKYSMAENYLEKILKISPENYLALRMLGYVFFEQKLYKEAISYFKKALKIKSNEYDLLLHIGVSLNNLNKYNEAQNYLQKGLKIKPNDTTILYNLGLSLFSQDKYNEATKYFKLLLKYKPKSMFINGVIGFSLFFSKKYKEATRYLKKALLEEKDKEFFLEMLIECLFVCNNHREITKILSKIELKTNKIDRFYNLNNLNLQAIEYNKKYNKLINIKKISSLCEYIEIINDVKKNNKFHTNFIYRGQNNCFFPLIPSIYRKDYNKQKEVNIIQDFNLKADAFFNHEMAHFDKVDKLALMQHHGVPTRLLDFTESPLVALYFALENIDKPNVSIAPCVYMLDLKAFPLNQNGCILSSDSIGSSKNAKTPFNKIFQKGNFAFSPKLKNKRLTAQRGIFVVFNKNESLEISVKTHMTKIIIPRPYIDGIKQELQNIGITPTTIYPDFEGLSKEIQTPRDFAQEKNVMVEEKLEDTIPLLKQTKENINKFINPE